VSLLAKPSMSGLADGQQDVDQVGVAVVQGVAPQAPTKLGRVKREEPGAVVHVKPGFGRDRNGTS
jgi:hypothetical protein